MKTLSLALAATLAVSSTAATAGNTLSVENDVIIPVPEMAPAGSSVGSLGSLGTGGAIALGVLGVAAVVAATRSDSGT